MRYKPNCKNKNWIYFFIECLSIKYGDKIQRNWSEIRQSLNQKCLDKKKQHLKRSQCQLDFKKKEDTDDGDENDEWELKTIYIIIIVQYNLLNSHILIHYSNQHESLCVVPFFFQIFKILQLKHLRFYARSKYDPC
jgi:hypothetical protein